MIRAAGGTQSCSSVPPVGRPSALERRGHRLDKTLFGTGQRIGTTGQLHDQSGVKPADQVDDREVLGPASDHVVPDSLALLAVQAAKHRQPANGEAGVVQIRITLAAAESSIGQLLRQQEVAMTPTSIGVDLGESPRQPVAQPQQIRFVARHTITGPRAVPSRRFETEPPGCRPSCTG